MPGTSWVVIIPINKLLSEIQIHNSTHSFPLITSPAVFCLPSSDAQLMPSGACWRRLIRQPMRDRDALLTTDRLLKQASLPTAHVPFAGNTVSFGQNQVQLFLLCSGYGGRKLRRNARLRATPAARFITFPTSRATQQQLCRISCRPQSRRATRSRRRLDPVIDNSLHLVTTSEQPAGQPGSDRDSSKGDSDSDTRQRHALHSALNQTIKQPTLPPQ